MASVGRALARIASTHPDVLIVFPIHRNPAVREVICPLVEGLDNVRVVHGDARDTPGRPARSR